MSFDDPTAPADDLVGVAVRALFLYSLAEFQGGNATTIRVDADGARFSIADDGRGHPLDKSLEGTSYLKFIYTHFEYPFASGRSAPIQLQGIGMSLVNALSSELTLTVKKAHETLRWHFQDARLITSERSGTASAETGINVTARLKPQFVGEGVAAGQLETWLLGVLKTCPTLRLYFNGRLLTATAGR